jgi:hypothetical protein
LSQNRGSLQWKYLDIRFLIGECAIRYLVGKALLGTVVEDELFVPLGDEGRDERLQSCSQNLRTNSFGRHASSQLKVVIAANSAAMK